MLAPKAISVGDAFRNSAQDLARMLESGVCLRARRISPVSVCVVVIKVVAHLFDDVPRHLRAAGPIEIGDWITVVYAFESGEVFSDFGN